MTASLRSFTVHIYPQDFSYFFFFLYYKVVDGNVSSGLIKSKQLSQITSLTGSYDVAWRKHDFAKYETAFLRHVLITVSLFRVTSV